MTDVANADGLQAEADALARRLVQGGALVTGEIVAMQGHTAALDRAGYAAKINAAWQKSLEGILEAGRELIAAKADPDLPHGEFEAMIGSDLLFGASTAQRLMKIARKQQEARAMRTAELLGGAV